MKSKLFVWLAAIFVMAFLSGCVTSTFETRTVHPDGTYTVESETETTPAGGPVVGVPWVGVGTPWVYWNDGWYYNGVLYGFYGTYGWWPYGYYGPNYIVRNNVWYNNNWYGFYRNNPNYYKNFHQKYHGGQKWHGQSRHPGQVSGHRGSKSQGQVNRGVNSSRSQGGIHRQATPSRGGHVSRSSGPSRGSGMSRPAARPAPAKAASRPAAKPAPAKKGK